MGCLIVGILNVTPDSFSDGGRYASPAEAVEAGVRMAEAGADWIDVGGESTRPGSNPVPEDEEKRRVLPVIERLKARLPAATRISIDTYKAGTAREALAAGASVVNDVSGGRLQPAILEVVAVAPGATIVLGHLRGTPQAMMDAIAFHDVVGEVEAELSAQVGRRVPPVVAISGRIPGSASASGSSTTWRCSGRCRRCGRMWGSR